ncbi:hypothetical protein [Streptomyces sp. NPDC052225]|uniref:hypothetical protein n=1 Tax=Streptomyces sp. NPDC052225 TaxID=3154949 RepID=UPI00343B9AED
MKLLRARNAAAGMGIAVLALMSVGVTPAQAAGENWTVYATFLSPKGYDIPLRYGRHDNTAGHTTGFGVYHIEDRNHRLGQSWATFKGDIDQVLHSSKTTCSKAGTTWTCTSHEISGVNSTWGNMKVSYTHSDTGTPDGRARGIITAYYLNDCGCFAPGSEGAKKE